MAENKPPDSSGSSGPDLAIVGDQVTLHPGGYEVKAGHEQNIVEHMARFRESPFDFLREISLHVSGSGWRAYDNPIGQPVYYPKFSENMKREVLATPMLRKEIEDLARRRLSVELEKGLVRPDDNGSATVQTNSRMESLVQSLDDVAEEMIDEMVCKMNSKRFIRSAYYIATALLTRAYHQGIHVSSEEVLRLRTVAQNAARNKQSIIFLPCHRSHVDYVSLQLICYRLGIALPTVVAGDNLAFVGVKQFLQNAGAMWMRRSFAGDALYGTVFRSYIETLMRLGYHLEAFIEGGRSRTGKLLPPKFGFLGYILDAVASGRVDDAIICPVSTQYDRVVEVESFVNELTGAPKTKENIMDFLSSSNVLSLKLGRVDVRFHEPWSLKQFLREQKSRVPLQVETDSVARTRLLRTLGYRVLSDINEVSVIMPTALVGTVLLTLRGPGVGINELIRRVEWLSDRVRAKGGRVAHFHGAPTSMIVDRALEVLGPSLITKVDGLAEDTYKAIDTFQLSFYRNMTIHLFISEALVSVAMYTKVKQGGGPGDQIISYRDLYYQIEFLSQLFKAEFIYPTDGLASNLHKTLEEMQADSIVQIHRNESGGIESVELTEAERRRGREDFDFYCFLIWPYVEASWLAAVSLMALAPPPGISNQVWISLKEAQNMAQFAGKTLYHQGSVSYYEAVNKETLKNAYERFIEGGIIEISRSRDPAIPATVRLAPDWAPARDAEGHILKEGKLWDFTETISKSRREGKDRRDGAIVSDHVLALAEKLGRELFERATALPDKGTTINLEKKRRTQNLRATARL